MQYFTILQHKLHSFNIQDDRSTRGLLAKPLKKCPKSHIQPAGSHFCSASCTALHCLLIGWKVSRDQLALSLNLGIFRTAKWEQNSTKIDKSFKFTLTSCNHAIRGLSNDSPVKSSNNNLHNYTNVLTIIQSKHFLVFGYWRLWTVWTPRSFQTSPLGIIDFISLYRSLLINRRLLTFFYMDIFENWQAKTDPRALLPKTAFIEWVIIIYISSMKCFCDRGDYYTV